MTRRPEPPAIVWFRADLRLKDNEALTAAVVSGRPLLACFVLDETEHARGGASRWWLHRSLSAHAAALETLGIQLVLRRGPAPEALSDLVGATGAEEIHTSASTTPYGERLDQRVGAALLRGGVELHRHPGGLLFDPRAVATRRGRPFRVFTPFWKACLRLPEPRAPLPAPQPCRRFAGSVETDALTDWALLPARPNWAAGFEEIWEPGEEGAHGRLEPFLEQGIAGYRERRDRPDLDGTSGLSPHLHFGEISPRQVWWAARSTMAVRPRTRAGGESFLRQLGWREFSYHLLHHWPDLPHAPFRREFDTFPWREDAEQLERWQQGRTGYPFVDAGMRQLWRSGWMHNRARMAAASFLVKHLLIPWRHGADWFEDTLVDADIANNSASWQWVAGCGADAAPYFRVFNPVLQGKKFDPDGHYVRRWVPELRALPTAHVHEPWSAPEGVLARSGIELGRDYPRPIVDHRVARERALEAYRRRAR